MQPEIEGKSIVVTRPAIQARQLVDTIGRLGGVALALPLIEIQSLKLAAAEKQKIIDLDQYDAIVVVSPNAARIGLEQIGEYWPQLPLHIDWYTVGRATANALAEFEITAEMPDQGFDSEALLALPGMQQIAGAKILILKGTGGRTLLREQLSVRGAIVEMLDLYQRNIVEYNSGQVLRILGTGLPDHILITSAQIFDHMHRTLEPCYDNLMSVNLVTASERISDRARKLGYERVKTAAGAFDEAMLSALAVPG